MSLLDEIKSKCPPDILTTKDNTAIANAVSIGRIKVVPTLGGIGTIMEALGAVDGATLLDTLETLSTSNSAVKWGMVLVNRGDFDFGSITGRQMIDMLVTDPVKNAKLKAVAEVPDPITEFDVRCNLYAPDGTFLG